MKKFLLILLTWALLTDVFGQQPGQTLPSRGSSGGSGSLPSQSGQTGKFLQSDGNNASWQSVAGATIATQGDAELGSDNTKMMTPIRVKQSILVDVVNNLTTTAANKLLDGRQGKALKDLIDALTTTVAGKQPTLPSQTGNDGKVLGTDGTNVAWVDQTGGGGSTTDASFLTSGTLPDGRLSANVPRLNNTATVASLWNFTILPTYNGVGFLTGTSGSSSQIRRGDGTLLSWVAGTDYLAPGGNGSGLTNLNGSNLASGTVPDARLGSNVAFKNATATVSALWNFTTAPTIGGVGVVKTSDVGTVAPLNKASATTDNSAATVFTTQQEKTLLAALLQQALDSIYANRGADWVYNPASFTVVGGAAELAPTGVTPGSYTNANVTVGADGRVTAVSNGSGGGSFTSASQAEAETGSDNTKGMTPLRTKQSILVEIVNNLTTTTANKLLDGRQGKALKDLIDALATTVAGKQSALPNPTGNTGKVLGSDGTNYVLVDQGGTVSNVAITSGTSTTLSNSTSTTIWVVINPSTTLASHAVTLPVTPISNQLVIFSFGGSITIGSVVSAFSTPTAVIQATTPGSVSAGEKISFRYNSTTSKWYRND